MSSGELNAAAQQQPLFTIGIVSRLLQVTQTTLRIWERKGLVKPRRLGKNRYYSYADLDRLQEIKYLLQRKRINIAGVKDMLVQTRCWEFKKCGREKIKCPVYLARERDHKWLKRYIGKSLI